MSSELVPTVGHEIEEIPTGEILDYEILDSTIQWIGDVWLIEYAGSKYFVSRAFTFDRGDETMIFPSNEAGTEVEDWGDLYAGYGEDHHTAIMNWINQS